MSTGPTRRRGRRPDTRGPLGKPALLANALLYEAHTGRAAGHDPAPLLEEAERVTEDPAVRARARAMRGSHHMAAGRPAEGRARLEEALAILDEHGIQAFLGTTLLWLGTAWGYDGHFERARPYHERALSTFEAGGHQAGAAHARVALVRDALNLDDLPTARAHLEWLRAMVEAHGSPWLQLRLCADEGWLLERTGDLVGAEASYRQGLALAERSEVPPLELRLRLARVLVRTGRRAECQTDDVCFELSAPVGGAELFDSAGDRKPGVCDRDIEATKFVDNDVDGSLHGVLVGDIAGHGEPGTDGRVELCDYFLKALKTAA